MGSAPIALADVAAPRPWLKLEDSAAEASTCMRTWDCMLVSLQSTSEVAVEIQNLTNEGSDGQSGSGTPDPRATIARILASGTFRSCICATVSNSLVWRCWLLCDLLSTKSASIALGSALDCTHCCKSCFRSSVPKTRTPHSTVGNIVPKTRTPHSAVGNFF